LHNNSKYYCTTEPARNIYGKEFFFPTKCTSLLKENPQTHWSTLTKNMFLTLFRIKNNAVASWLVCSSPDRAVWVRALAGDIALCSWARHFTLTVPLSTQVYKWVPANLMLGVTLRWTSIPSREGRNTPSRFMLQKPG